MARDGSGAAALGRILLDEVLSKPGSITAQRKQQMAGKRKVATPKSQPKRRPTTRNKPSAAKGGDRTKATPRRGGTVSADQTEGQIIPEQIGSKVSEGTGMGVKSLDVTNARVTQDELTSTQVVYPYSVDMFISHSRLYPAGDSTSSDSIARDYFESATGVKLLTDINIGLRKSNSITVDEVADFINKVANAYATLLSVRNHINACYSAVHHNAMRLRLGIIYDESIPPAYIKLAGALRAFYLPPDVIKLCEMMSAVYLTAPDDRSPMLQFTPYAALNNTPASYVTTLSAQNTVLDNISNYVDIITAFSSPNYPSSTLKMERLQPDTLVNGDDEFLKVVQPQYNPSFLNIWGNQPYHASDGVSARITDLDLAARTTNIYKFAFSNDFDFVENVLTSDYITADSRYQPGFVEPQIAITGAANRTNLTFLDATGTEGYVNNNGFGSYPFGVLALNGKYCYNTTDQVAVRIGTTSEVVTTARDTGQDAYRMVKRLNGISESR